MNNTPPPAKPLADMPLWRLLVLLADIERESGAATPSARVVARLINERLRERAKHPTEKRKGVARA
jgi:hypothetical protein